MKIAHSTVTMLTIASTARLDPIDVFIVNYAPGKGRMTIRCWDRAWTCAWFAMRDLTIEEFFLEADSGYILANLTSGLSGMRKADARREAPYVTRIIEAVKAALRLPAPATPSQRADDTTKAKEQS